MLEPFVHSASATVLLHIVIVIAVAVVVHLTTRRLFERHLRQENLSSDRRTGVQFLRNGIKALIVFTASVGVIYCVPALRSLAVGMFAGAGILAAIVGFASQHAFSNIVSGIFIVIFKPFRVHDIVLLRGEIGTIEDITLRHTVIRALENKRIIYPNSVIDSEPIINWTIADEKAEKYMYISVGFEADMPKAIGIIQRTCAEHPDLLDMRTDADREAGQPLVEVPVLDLTDSMVNFRIPLWAKDLPTAMRMTWDLHARIKQRFDEAGIPLGRPSQVNYAAEALMQRRVDDYAAEE